MHSACVRDLQRRLHHDVAYKHHNVACCTLPSYHLNTSVFLTLTVLVTTIDAQWEGMGDVGLARYEPALLPPCPTIKVLSYSN